MTTERSLTLAEMQARLKSLLAGLEHPPLGAATALSEEVGEVARHLLDHHAYGRPFAAEALASELADVLVCISEIATLHGIDLSDAAERKLVDLAGRVPKWKLDLGAALDAAWKHPSGPGARRPD